jgi:Ca-activated chloride channel family protein
MVTRLSFLRVFTAILLSVLFLPGMAAEQNDGVQPGNGPTIRVSVDMISLPVIVTTAKGQHIRNLHKDDFRVYEDNVEQEIAGFAATDEPLAIALLLDTSGSTRNDLARIQNAAIDFVNQLHPDDEVAVLSFADDVRLQSDFSIDRKKNERGIKMTRTGESTVLYEAVWLALEQVLKPVTERKALVLFTDGVDTRSRDASMKETLDLSKETEATIYCVYYNTEQRSATGLTIDPGSPSIILSPFPRTTNRTRTGSTPEEAMRGRAYLKDLADNSGGLVLDGNKNLGETFSEIAKELSSQYRIDYYPTNTEKDSKFRKVKIKMKNPDFRVRTRKGYYAKRR